MSKPMRVSLTRNHGTKDATDDRSVCWLVVVRDRVCSSGFSSHNIQVPHCAYFGSGVMRMSRSSRHRNRSNVSLFCSCKTLNESGAPSVDRVSLTS